MKTVRFDSSNYEFNESGEIGIYMIHGFSSTTYEVLKLAKRAHNLLGCRGVTRSDFRFFKNQFYLLETNTQPGMTNLSLVPEIAKYTGMRFDDLIVWILKDASINR